MGAGNSYVRSSIASFEVAGSLPFALPPEVTSSGYQGVLHLLGKAHGHKVVEVGIELGELQDDAASTPSPARIQRRDLNACYLSPRSLEVGGRREME